MAVSCTSLTCDQDLIIVKLTVLIVRGDEAGCASTRLGGLLVSLFLVEEENNVGNVVQSEKSPQNSQ